MYLRCVFVKVNPGSGVAMFFPIVPDTMGMITIEVVAQSTIAADGLRQYLLVEVTVISYNFWFMIQSKKNTQNIPRITSLIVKFSINGIGILEPILLHI